MPQSDNQRRRLVLWIAVAVIAGGATAAFLRLRNKELVAAAPVPQVVDGGTLRTNSDATEIFQRAFWKRPGPEDKILHAERREWISDTDGVRKWEWFLAIEPGPGLVAEIRERYSLKPAVLVPEKFATAPDWLRTRLASGAAVFTDPAGLMQLVVSEGGKLLLATGAGGGFARPVKSP